MNPRLRNVLGCCSLVAMLGCGGADLPELYNLSGKVEFNGEPVPYGQVEFEPDTAAGNSGGMGYATIVNGRYDTAAPGGRGVVGGPHVVYFTGGPEVPPEQPADDYVGPPIEQPEMWFVKFAEKHDLPSEDSELDFIVPPDATDTLKDAPAARRPANEP